MLRFTLLLCVGCAALSMGQAPQALGIFDAHTDIGAVLNRGDANFDASTQTYTVSGSGNNMWFASDELHFVWKKISAEDLTLSATISILGEGGDAHRKAVLMVRQGLGSDEAYVDAARHGEGLTSLQFREKKGAITREIESNISGPAELRLEKRGRRFYMWVAAAGEDWQFAGGSAWVEIRAPFYVGLGVCAHDKNALEKATFRDVELDTNPKQVKGNGKFSTIQTVLLSGDARSSYVTPRRVTSPGWSADGKQLTFQLDNKDEQTPFTPLRTAAPVGAPVMRSTGANFTYYPNKSGGVLQIWRRSADGSQAIQFTPDDSSNTSPHVSPDGKYLLFLSYSKHYKALSENMPMELRLMNLSDNSIKTLCSFIGGPYSLGDNPWSPDAKRVVFVSYQSMK